MKKITSILIFTTVLTSVISAQIRLGGVKPSSFSLDYSNPQTFEIGGITVSGTEFLDQSAIISLSGLKVGDKIEIPGDKISMAIKKLWDQGILGNIELRITKIEGMYVFLDFHLEEKPRLTKFTFEGVRKSDADEIREKINLIRGRVVTDAMIKNTELQVKNHYVQKGFRNVDVSITQQPDSIMPNSVYILIKVNKNERVKIKEIEIIGNESVDIKKLKRKMKDTKEAKKLRVFKMSKLLPNAYSNDKQKIISYYNSKGFRDASIAFDTIYDVNENRVKIEMEIDEGNPYYFGDIIWVGNYLHDDKELGEILGIKKGTVYNKELLDERLNFNPSGMDITSVYMDDGYLFFNITPVEVNVRNDTIDIEMRIYEGEQATINKIIINGNTKTSDHVIRRELRTLPGQKFSRMNLIRTQRELSQLGYFDPEQMGIVPIPNPQDGTVDIEYTLTERANDQFTMSGGWGGWYGFVGTVGLVFNNFSAQKIFKLKEYDPLPGGDGQRLSIQMQATGRQFQSYSISFTEPWLGGKKPNSLTVSPRHTRFGLDSSNLKTTGITVYLAKRLTVPDDFFNLSHSVSIQRYDLKNYRSNFASFPFETGSSYDASFNTTISRYDVGLRPEYPTSGSSVSLSASFTPPYSLFDGVSNYSGFSSEERYKFAEYHKWMFDAQWYKSLLSSKTKTERALVLNLRFHAGVLGTYNKNLGYSPFGRFIMGGSGISGQFNQNFLLGYDNIALRGFQDSNPPFRGDGFLTTGAGGTKFTKFVGELRYPISLNPMATVFPLVFLDMGNNWNEYRKFEMFNLYKTAGVGVRIFMPMFGMLGFDYGFLMDDYQNTGDPFHKRGNFNFTIGQQIR